MALQEVLNKVTNNNPEFTLNIKHGEEPWQNANYIEYKGYIEYIYDELDIQYTVTSLLLKEQHGIR